MRIETTSLRAESPGSDRALTALKFGAPGAGPKVYLQAGLHADEMPGVLILQHLLPLLERAEDAGRIAGEIVVVPLANPLGLSQWAAQKPMGRHEADSLHNFNRGFPALADLVADGLEPALTQNAEANRDLIRAAFRAALAERRAQAKSQLAEMQVALLQWSCDADVVLDLHCDHFAVLHLYASPARPEITELLCRCIGAELALIQDISGGNAFDEAHTVPWLLLQRRFGERFPIPSPCFSTTLEYRGQFDVSATLADTDARNLMTFLTAIGALTGSATPAHPACPQRPLGGAGEAFAPQGGLVHWLCKPGVVVTEGQTLAQVVDPITRLSLPVPAPNAGILFRRELWHACLRGQSLAHVAGESILRAGDLLSD
jgi:predicted deacylase